MQRLPNNITVIKIITLKESNFLNSKTLLEALKLENFGI